jgi:hypothetical protein
MVRRGTSDKDLTFSGSYVNRDQDCVPFLPMTITRGWFDLHAKLYEDIR